MRLTPSIIIFGATAFLLFGCSSKEKERMELEEKVRRQEAAGNKAITDMNRHIFGKKEQPATPAPPAPPVPPVPTTKSDDASKGSSSTKP